MQNHQVFATTHHCTMMVMFAFLSLIWHLIVTLATFLIYSASYLPIHELAQELTRARTALVAARSYPTPPSMGFTPYIVRGSSSLISPVTPPTSSGTSTVNPHSAPAEWASLLATSATPMIPSHPAPTSEREPSRQRCRVTFNQEVSVYVNSSRSGSDSGEDPAAPAES